MRIHQHLFSLFLLLPITTLAQSRAGMMPGYVVATSGDTLRGLLDVPAFPTAKGITLRTTTDAATQHFTVQNARAFSLQDGRRFVTRTIVAGLNSETGAADSATVFLQQLIAGAATFYRYEYATFLHSYQSDRSGADKVQYYVALGQKIPVQVRRLTYQSVLPVLFKDCPPVADAVKHTTFSEQKLGDLVLHYDTTCQAATPAYDHRLPVAPPLRLLFSVRAGAQRTQLFYSSPSYIRQDNAQASTQPAYALEMRMISQNAWSVSAGVQYAKLRSTAVLTQPAQLGTVNAGQMLELPIAVEVHSVQIPLMLRYTLSYSLLRPYLAAGAMVGTYFTNRTTLSYTTLTYVGGTTTYYRNEVVTETAPSQTGGHPMVSGVVRLGIQFKTKARISPLLEVQYSAGKDKSYNPGVQRTINGSLENLGNLHYRALSVTAGLEF